MGLVSEAIRQLVAQGGSSAPSGILYSSLGYVDGDPLVSGSGSTILMDVPSVKHSSISVSGVVRAMREHSARLWGNSIVVRNGGLIEVGTEASPFPGDKEFEFVVDGARPTVSGNAGGGQLVVGFTHIVNASTGNNGTTNDNFGISRGITIEPGGNFVVVATRPGSVFRTKLNSNWTASTGIALAEPMPLTADDTLWISPTSYYNAANRTQALSVAANSSGTAVILAAAPTYPRWGQMQYATDTGISLTQGPWTDGRTSSYTGSITGTTLTITAVGSGTISVGQKVRATVLGTFIVPGTDIVQQLSGTAGGVGTYQVSKAQNSAANMTLRCVGMKAHADMTPDIDQRSYITNPKSNVVIRAATDAETGTTAIATFGFGVHVMKMGITGKTFIQDVQFKDFGHSGLFGRYGVHFHINSWGADGVDLGTFAPGQAVVRRCTFDTGHNRAMVLHACKGVTLEDNVSYRAQGHAIMLEEGSELGNIVSGNWTLRTEVPAVGRRLKTHDSQATGLWLSNFGNTIYDNHLVDSDGFGLWNAISSGLVDTRPSALFGCLGFSRNVQVQPVWIPVVLHDLNTVFCNGQQGMSTDLSPVDNQGNLGSPVINSFDTGVFGGNEIVSPIKRLRAYKNATAYINRIDNPWYELWKLSDNGFIHLQGAVQGRLPNAIADKQLVIKQSLNNLDGVTIGYSNAWASYHGALPFVDISAYGYNDSTPTYGGRFNDQLVAGGLIQTWDLYLAGLQMWTLKMTNWRLHDSLGAYFTPPAHLTADDDSYDAWNTDVNLQGVDANPSAGGSYQFQLSRRSSLGPAIYDFEGALTGEPGSWFVHSAPFITAGLNFTPSGTGHRAKMGRISGAQMYGIHAVNEGGFGNIVRDWRAQRVDNNHADIAGAFWHIRSRVGEDRANGNCVTAIGTGQRFRVSHPSDNKVWSAADGFFLTIENCTRSTDNFVMGVKWSGVVTNIFFFPENYTSIPKANKAAFDAESAFCYWNDTANSTLWIKYVGKGENTFHFSESQGAYRWGTLYVT